jgi:hypothetical protein
MRPTRALADTTPVSAAAAGRPRDQDIVVSRPAPSSEHYIGQHPGEAQFTAASREEARRLARAFARRHDVDVWYREGETYHALDRFRPPRTD